MTMLSEPLWTPNWAAIGHANLTAAIREVGLDSYEAFHEWSVQDRDGFWGLVLERLHIDFTRWPERILQEGAGVEGVRWLPGAELNIAASCFHADPTDTAIVARFGGSLHEVSYGALHQLVLRVANGLVARGCAPGDRVAIAMPMTVEAVAAYLGIVWAGGVAVSIADSFAPDEIATRLLITNTDTVITQDRIVRAGRQLPMYEKVVAAGAAHAIVVETGGNVPRRDTDTTWDAFLGDDRFVTPAPRAPGDAMNILFSSGTTGDPKAIPWTHATPIKSAMDGHFHQDIHPDDVVAWPTNLGWMMGPWLIYATFINRATMALFDDAPTEADFGEFVEQAGVTILGLVPSLVAAWRTGRIMEPYDWSAIRLFSSTGEASNPIDMAYLMGLAGNKPIIEYIGGTEIGGGFLSGTLLQPAIPSLFTTPTLGLDVVLLDDDGRRSDVGEVFIVPPSIGLSTRLLNRDHHEVYFDGVPVVSGVQLRRHGDHMERLENGYYHALGRVDDAMNLGGIKVSSTEIERVVLPVAGVAEAAAVAVAPPGGGPSHLVIFAVPEAGAEPSQPQWRSAMQQAIREHLNPLFKIHGVVVVESLPRTASGKVKRRKLRDEYSG